MKVLVIGAGFVGSAAATELAALGHEVTVTATSEEKVITLKERFGRAVVLRGSDADSVAAAVADKDAVVITAGPSAQGSMTPEGRAKTYRDVLVTTAENVVAAAGPNTRLVSLSSLSVYGDAANHLDQIDESSPVTDSADPSPSNFLAMERTYSQAGDRAVILRCGDIFGQGDPPIAEKVKMAHQYLGGSVPFSGEALLYRLHVEDAAAAVVHAVENDLSGVFNLTHAEVPPTNARLFDTLSAEQGLPPLEYRNEIASPSSPISVERLAATGFRASKSFDPALTALR
ncbi:NAD-dependent epimerase/dehydratase family protein [Aeromicrobium wangtongii]|uniref:NAD(P)-dependent oxidoreductase n=1 Tax=Aeromicrobium wangtongii TaxID=2969247 RepID=A0ABY5M648_9ACTN|nr:NAD(P)-dependent oxidoreductase [Aeromicrobium wangtongii]MCD9198606.1 NAD(P)-dependent oxidoreductase [Aeromicrobium wangtongii]UUP12631.1 NAD(P)-dependent oxidoreductase [Aeromicrobium wangtongii]